MASSDPAEVAALFDVVASEAVAMQQLTGAVDLLRAAYDARRVLARSSPDALRAALLLRRGSGRS